MVVTWDKISFIGPLLVNLIQKQRKVISFLFIDFWLLYSQTCKWTYSSLFRLLIYFLSHDIQFDLSWPGNKIVFYNSGH